VWSGYLNTTSYKFLSWLIVHARRHEFTATITRDLVARRNKLRRKWKEQSDPRHKRNNSFRNQLLAFVRSASHDLNYFCKKTFELAAFGCESGFISPVVGELSEEQSAAKLICRGSTNRVVKITFGAAIASCRAARVQFKQANSLQWDRGKEATAEGQNTKNNTQKRDKRWPVRASESRSWVIHFIRMLCLALSTKSTHGPHCAAAAD
jgi:hypothetical protein